MLHGTKTTPTLEIASSLLRMEITLQTLIALDVTFKDSCEVSPVKTYTVVTCRRSHHHFTILFVNGATIHKTQLV